MENGGASVYCLDLDGRPPGYVLPYPVPAEDYPPRGSMAYCVDYLTVLKAGMQKEDFFRPGDRANERRAD